MQQADLFSGLPDEALDETAFGWDAPSELAQLGLALPAAEEAFKLASAVESPGRAEEEQSEEPPPDEEAVAAARAAVAAAAAATHEKPTQPSLQSPLQTPFQIPAGVEQLPLAVAAHRAIDRLMEAGHPCVVAFSSGKDSSVVANLTLTTAAVRIATGRPVPQILVIHSDTGVENPEVRLLADAEIAKIRKFGRDYGIPVEVRIGKPLLYSSWPVRVISGRALPSFPNSSRDCSVEFKVKVSRRLTVAAFQDLAGGEKAAGALLAVAHAANDIDKRVVDVGADDPEAAPGGAREADSNGPADGALEQVARKMRGARGRSAAEGKRGAAPVVMTGVRKGESIARNTAIQERGESADAIWQDDGGRSYMSPIMEWTGDDVFEYLGYANSGVIPAYSDFDATLQFYRDAGGSSCAVVGAMKIEEDIAKQKGGCGARSGCWTCVRVQKDQSLQTMIVSDPQRYGYLEGLGTLRDFVANTQYDWTRRNFIGRTIDKNGCIAIQADTYSPQMLEELLHYALSLQAAENATSMRRGKAPRFEIIGPREIIGIDALWSLYGLHKPFHAIDVMLRVDRGDLRFPPKTTPFERSPVPRYGNLFVGADWHSEILTGDPVRDRMISGGIRDPILEMFEDSCGVGSELTTDGERVTSFATEESFDVDEEAAADFLGCGMAEEMHAKLHDKPGVMWTEAVKHYLSMGLVAPSNGGLARWHRIAKRSDWLQRHGLNGQVQVEELRQMLALQAQDIAEHGDASASELRLRA